MVTATANHMTLFCYFSYVEVVEICFLVFDSQSGCTSRTDHMKFHLSSSSFEENLVILDGAPSSQFVQIKPGPEQFDSDPQEPPRGCLPFLCTLMAWMRSTGHGSESQSEPRHHSNIQAIGTACARALSLV